jgi:hypothetical protein
MSVNEHFVCVETFAVCHAFEDNLSPYTNCEFGSLLFQYLITRLEREVMTRRRTTHRL